MISVYLLLDCPNPQGMPLSTLSTRRRAWTLSTVPDMRKHKDRKA